MSWQATKGGEKGMKDMKVKVFIQDLDEVKNLIQSVSDLMQHIDQANFQDSCGNALKMNSTYFEVKSALKGLIEKTTPEV